MLISNCCGAIVRCIDYDQKTGICSDCKEHCDCEEESDSEFCNGKMD